MGTKGVLVVEFDHPENQTFIEAVEQIIEHLDLSGRPISIRIGLDRTAEAVIAAFKEQGGESDGANEAR